MPLALKPQDIQKLQNLKDGVHKDLKGFENFEAQSKYIGKFLEKVKQEFKVFAGSKVIDIRAKFPVVVKHMIMCRDYMQVSADTAAMERLVPLVKALQKIESEFSSGKITGATELREKLNGIYTRLSKVTQDESAVDALNDNKKAFSALKHIPMAKSNGLVYAMSAPLMLTGYTNKSDREKLVRYLKIKNLAGYNIIESAKFIVLDLTKAEKLNAEPEAIISKHLQAINKNLGSPVIAIHDVTLELHNKYVAWVVPEKTAKYITGFLDNLEDYEIFIN